MNEPASARPKRVAITGGGGFIGSETIAPLLRRGYEVHLLSRRAPSNAATHWHDCDLLTEDATPLLEEIGASHLLHLAWDVPPGKFWRAPENLDWVAASLRLVRAFAATGGQRACIAGTCAEYSWSHGLLDEAHTPLEPATLYGLSKLSLWRLLTAAADDLGLSLGWGRIFFPFGPADKPGRLVSAVVDGIVEHRVVPCSIGTQVRDFMHVADVARALVELLDSRVEGAVNIASGEVAAVRDVILRVAQLLDGEELIAFGALPLQPGEPPRLEASIGRLRDEVGFRPQFSLAEGLADAVLRRRQLLSADRR